MHIPPWTILAGFGSLSRRELSDLLAVFEDTTLFNVVASRVKDLAGRVGTGEDAVADGSFRRLLKEGSDRVFESDRTEALLRLKLWHRTRASLDLKPAIPLAMRTANQSGTALDPLLPPSKAGWRTPRLGRSLSCHPAVRH